MKKNWILCLVILTCSCSEDFIPVNFQVEGAQNAVIVRIDGEHTVPWDTIEVINNKLEIDLPLDSTLKTFYYFIFNSGSSLRIGLEPGDNITGSINAKESLTNYKINGSSLSEQLHALYEPVLKSSHIIDSLDQYRIFSKNNNGVDLLSMEKRHYSTLESRYFQHKNEVIEIMAKDSSSLSNVFGFFQKVADVPLFSNKEDDRMNFNLFCDAISRSHPNHPLARIFIFEKNRILAKE
tara:strand:+ start:110 stop:820 length:711 start_codon:yes stop_codon:yes gene_type:complete